MILSANILLISSWINADEIKKVTYIISFSEIQKSLDGGKNKKFLINFNLFYLYSRLSTY